MAETMTGKVTTFAELEKDLNNRAEQPPQAAELLASQPANPPPAEPPPSNGAEQPAAEQKVEVDNAIAQFDLTLGDEPAQVQPPAQPQQPAYNWKEEIKKLPVDEVIAAIGLDPFAVELDKHIKGGGQPLDYLNARAIDYNKISDDSLIKVDLQSKNPTFSPAQIDLFFNRRYGVPEDASDEDKEFASLQLKAEAHNLRQSKILEQNRFKIADTPIPQKDEAYEVWQQNVQTQAQQVEQLKNYYSNHEATKKLNESKRVTVSLGDDVAPFNWNINQPDLITRAFTDDGSIWQKITSTPQGEPDVEKQQLIALFAYNPKKFISDIFNYGKSMGVQKELVDEGRNAQKPQGIVTKMTNETGKATPIGTGKFGDKSR